MKGLSMADKHKCKAKGCDKQTLKTMLMCRRHWHLVPHEVKQLIWKNEPKGDKSKVTRVYIQAVRRAVSSVHDIEVRLAARNLQRKYNNGDT